MDGFLLIDKPIGMTSHDVVFKVKKKLKLKKVGHTGTLDPFASGLLILCLGKATKLANLFSNLDKSYEGTIDFNKHYDTYDTTGHIVEEKNTILTEEEIYDTAKLMVKTYDQLPPMYSAIKIDGKKLYDLARQGLDIERPKRHVVIYKFDILNFKNNKSDFIAHVSKGTYIRSLAVDFAEKLNTLAALSSLRRLSVGNYHVNSAKTLDNVKIEDVITLDAFFETYKTLELSDYLVRLVKNGVYLDQRQTTIDEPFVVVDKSQNKIAYYEPAKDGKYKPILIF